MDYYSNQISKLIDELSRLPGIGAKSASRLAFHLIHMPKEEVKRLADTMVEARENVRYCKECCTLTDQELGEEIRKIQWWDHDLCTELARRAGLETEWENSDDETFEHVLFSAAEILGIELL